MARMPLPDGQLGVGCPDQVALTTSAILAVQMAAAHDLDLALSPWGGQVIVHGTYHKHRQHRQRLQMQRLWPLLWAGSPATWLLRAARPPMLSLSTVVGPPGGGVAHA